MLRIRSFLSNIIRIPLFGILVLSLISACLAKDPESLGEGIPLDVVLKLNKNVEGLRNLASACMAEDSVAVFCIEYNEDESVSYLLELKTGNSIELYGEIISDLVRVPKLSMEKENDAFFWTVNGAPLLDSDGNKITVADLTRSLFFFFQDESILCKVKDSIVGEYPFTKADYSVKDVSIEFDIDIQGFSFSLSSGYRTIIPTIKAYSMLFQEEQNRSFYKDVFLDAGVALTSRRSLAASEYLGLSLEGICFSSWNPDSKDAAMQKAIISGDMNDSNGRLLFPDGQPRYKLLFVNGGLSYDHGQSLGEKGLVIMRSFVNNGGCYVGTCAGAFFASNGFNGKKDYPYYLSIWPGMMRYTYLENTPTGMFLEPQSPLLKYFDFGGDYYVGDIRHNEGGYPVDFPLYTEILARYDYPQQGSIHRKPSIWAYKCSPKSGRVVMEGSHPEEVLEGERRDLTAAMMLYAMDGVGTAALKGCLINGRVRKMDKKTEDNDPDHTRIGDLQTHHFATYIPAGAKNIRVEINSSSDCDFALMLNQGSYAFSDTAEYCSTDTGQHLFLPSLKEGYWFIGVKCLTTVTVVETEYGQAYSGQTEVLNGIPYQVSIRWD